MSNPSSFMFIAMMWRNSFGICRTYTKRLWISFQSQKVTTITPNNAYARSPMVLGSSCGGRKLRWRLGCAACDQLVGGKHAAEQSHDAVLASNCPSIVVRLRWSSRGTGQATGSGRGVGRAFSLLDYIRRNLLRGSATAISAEHLEHSERCH